MPAIAPMGRSYNLGPRDRASDQRCMHRTRKSQVVNVAAEANDRGHERRNGRLRAPVVARRLG